jgi:hypothetical protein
MILISWLVPVLASALLIWLLAMLLSSKANSASLGQSIIAAIVLGLVNVAAWVFLRPYIGGLCVLAAFIANVLAICGLLRLTLFRSCLLLLFYTIVVGLLVQFVSHYPLI